MRRVSAKLALWVGALLIGVSAMGCCKPTDYRSFDTVTVSLDNDLRDATTNKLPTVQVNLLAVNDTDLPTWNGIGIDNYFAHPSGSAVVVKLGEDHPSQTLSTKDSNKEAREMAESLWKAKYKNLIVLCDYPPLKPGNAENRRKNLELVCPNWPQGQTELKIRVTANGLMTQ